MAEPEQSGPNPTIQGRVEPARLANRLTVAFVLDMVSIARGDRHVLDALLISTITQANIAPILQQGDLQVAYATVEEAVPDELRRPISINALANSMGLPFETVRRRVKGLVDEGICAYRDTGVVLPTSAFTSPERVKSGFLAYERLRAFYYQLRDLGLMAMVPPPTVKMEPSALPMRTAVRLGSQFVLRAIEVLMRTQGDAMKVLILLQVFVSNTEGFTTDMAGGSTYEAPDMIPDKLRRPVRTSTLSRLLGLPQETVRRHVDALVESDSLARVQGGVIVSAESLARTRVRSGIAENIANMQRLFTGLSQLGVLAIWDQLNPAQTETAAPAASMTA